MVRPTSQDEDDDEPVERTEMCTSLVFGQQEYVRELPGIEKIEITRGLDQDTATATIALTNAVAFPMGAEVETWDYGHDRIGWFTDTRGEVGNPWGDEPNDWRGWIVPDRIVRTYEGYGADMTLPADKDPNMYQSGVWLIDDVVMAPDGSLTLECRDVGRELVESVLFPPVVPWDMYPLVWEKMHGGKTITAVTGVTDLRSPTYDTDSSQPYIGAGIVDGNAAYVTSTGSVRGHHGRAAFDADTSTHWLSVGNKSPKSSSAWEWVQGDVTGDVQGVKVSAFGGPYEVYISVMVAGQWKGRAKVGYTANMIDAGTRIKYVRRGKIGKGKTKVFALPRQYQNVEKVRVTLHGLWNSGVGSYPFRGALREVKVATTVTTEQRTVGGIGNYSDYSDIVKHMLAWCGFYWPSSQWSKIRSSDGTDTSLNFTANDPVLGKGRVWGDIQQMGVGGEEGTKLEQELWDHKPVIDGIRYIRDIAAFTFFVDESGAAVFRQPNIWTFGNWRDGARTTDVLTLSDGDYLLSSSLTLSSRSRRDRIFVANPNGKYKAVAKGYNPWKTDLRRVAGWTDANFSSQKEVTVMSRLIAVRQAMRMRSVPVEIPGNPAIQLDDQVIVRERITGINYLFHVTGIRDSWDAASGKWTYALTLEWLGWPDRLMTTTEIDLGIEAKAYLKAMGVLP